MRTFWIAILLLAVAVIAWMSRDDAARPNPALATNNTDVTVGDAPPTNAAVNIPNMRGSNSPATSPDDASIVSTAGALRAPNASPAIAPGAPATASSSNDDAQALADELAKSSDDSQEDDIADVLDDGSVPAPSNNDAAPATGSIIDGTYVLGGDGSAESPFEITWDLLILASQTFQPRQGKTDIPPQVQAMHGKHIKIAGYFALPMASTDPKEVLFMLNMWDGCCIGIPPSPFDAIEVRLREPLSGQKQVANYGTLSGTLKVDPYVENGWLLGMYLMEDGSLEAGL